MEKIEDIMSLKAKRILVVDTQKGYMQVLEYMLQDLKSLHVVQWHFYNAVSIDKDILPISYNKTFYDCKDKALQFAEKQGNYLLRVDF